MSDWSKELEVAVRASNQAVELALRYQPGVVAETKSDKSPVTTADRECEKLIARVQGNNEPVRAVLPAHLVMRNSSGMTRDSTGAGDDQARP